MDQSMMKDKSMGQMSDLGQIDNYGNAMPEPSSTAPDKKKKRYPRTSFTTDQLPGLKGATVGQKVKIMVEAEVVEVSQGEGYLEPGESEEDAKKKVRVEVKMLQGQATLESEMTPEEQKTFSEQEQAKTDNFNKTIGVEDDTEGE